MSGTEPNVLIIKPVNDTRIVYQRLKPVSWGVINNIKSRIQCTSQKTLDGFFEDFNLIFINNDGCTKVFHSIYGGKGNFSPMWYYTHQTKFEFPEKE